MKISIQIQSLLAKDQTELFKGKTKAKLYLSYCHSFAANMHLNYKYITRNFLQNLD